MFRCRPRGLVPPGPFQRWLIALVLLAAACAVRADDDGLVARVGRVAAVEGVLYRASPDASADWTVADLNFPITGGDDLWLADGRAEIDYGGGRIRFAGGTRLHVSRLDDARLALFVEDGRVLVRVRWLEPGEVVAVDTPHAQVQLDRPGRYRIDVLGDRGATLVAVGEGEAQLWLPDGTLRALPGQRVEVTGARGERPEVLAAGSADDLDAWSAARDRQLSGRTYAYAPRDMIGAGDLDAYGTWESSPAYGTVWYPTAVVADWAPYSVGRWTWLPAWGWTWVDAAPWGYAPFHYGRWVHVDGRWGWCPGPRPLRPVWAPALVAWYGGSGWGLPVVAGQAFYGWTPLGWGEPYVPVWSSCNGGCWDRFNRPFAVDPGARHVPLGRFANAAVPGGLTAVAGGLLASGQPVTGHRVPVPFEVARSAPVLASLPPPAMAHAPGRSPSGLRDAGGLASMGTRPFTSDASPWNASPRALPAPPNAGGAGLANATTAAPSVSPRALDDRSSARKPAVEGNRRASPASGLAATVPARVDRWPAPDVSRRMPETGTAGGIADRRAVPRAPASNGLVPAAPAAARPPATEAPAVRGVARHAPAPAVRASPAFVRVPEPASGLAPRVASMAPPTMPSPSPHAAAPVWTVPSGPTPAMPRAVPPGVPPAHGAPPASHAAPSREQAMPARPVFER